MSQPGARAGLHLRPWRDEADFEAMTQITNRASLADGLDVTWDAGAFERYFAGGVAGPDYGAAITMAELDGRPVGFALGHWDQDRDGRRILWTRCRVDPDRRRLGIGGRLLQAAQASARRHASTMPPSDLSMVFQTRIGEREAGAEAVLRGDGYVPTHWLIRMVRPTLDDPPPDSLPPGIEVRPTTRETALSIIRAMDEAVGDEWWWVKMSEAQMAASLEDPSGGQIDVWQVAWAGDEIVGGVLGFVDAEENAEFGRKRGYTERIFTRWPWRGRGIATALIGRNLRELSRRGMTEAALMADSTSQWGTLALYERLGFRRDRAEVVWERPA